MKLYTTPLSSYAHKVQIAFEEKGLTYERINVNLMDPQAAEEYRKIYPIGKVPCLFLDNDHMIPESSIIVEYLDQHFEPKDSLIPSDPELGRQVRFKDRMYDLYLNNSVGELFFASMKPKEEQDQQSMDECRRKIDVMYGFMEKNFADKEWNIGNQFTLADCSAAPALYYAVNIHPFAGHKNIESYYDRLMNRPSIKNVYDKVSPIIEEFFAKQQHGKAQA